MSNKANTIDLDKLDNILSNIEAQEDGVYGKLHNFLKVQYSDVCSDGDAVINQIIDYLFSCDDDDDKYYYYKDESCEQRKKNITKYINSTKRIKSVSSCCIKYIEDDIKKFIDTAGNIKADPWWAS